jgi:hypothetical protein
MRPPIRNQHALRGAAGELIMVRLTIPAQDLEDTLEALAGFDFPVNPELFHRGAETTIEFPAYTGQFNHLATELAAHGQLETVSMLTEIGR